VRKAEFGFFAFPGDLKDNVGAIPLGLVLDKVKFGFRYMPYDFLARYKFCDLLGAAVKVLVRSSRRSLAFQAFSRCASRNAARLVT
jgi:hypothetical protein